MRIAEPLRSRLYLAVFAVWAAVVFWMRIDEFRYGTLWYGVMLLAQLGVIGGLVAVIVRMAGAAKRPARFAITPTGFAVPPLVSLGLFTGFLLVMSAQAIGGLIALGDVHRWWFWANTVPMLLASGLAVVFAWRGTMLELRPDGVHQRGSLLWRVIPWDALAAGGPPRPPYGDKYLYLATSRPDLVRQKGISLGSGPAEQPRLMLRMKVHPWFLADAIRWYTEHPQDRAAIGAPAEHERLMAVLSGRS